MKAFTSMNRKTRFNRAQSDSMIGVQQRINNNEDGITNAVTEFLNSYNKSNDDDDFYKNINNDSDHDHDSDNNHDSDHNHHSDRNHDCDHNHDHDSSHNYDSYHDQTPDNDHNHDGFNNNIDDTNYVKNDNLDNSNTDSCSCSDDNDNNSNNNDMDDTTSNHINKISSFVGRQVTFNPFKNNSVRPADSTVVADSTNLNMEQNHHHH